MSNTPSSEPIKNSHEFLPVTLQTIKTGKNSIQTNGRRSNVEMALGLYSASGQLTAKQFIFETTLEHPLKPFNYSKPTPESELLEDMADVERKKEGKPREGYCLLAIIKAPEGVGLMRSNHLYGEGVQYALVAATDARGEDFRYFPFDCLESEYQAQLLRDYPIIEVK